MNETSNNDNPEARLKVFKAIAENPEWINTLEEAMRLEGQRAGDTTFLGWEWYECHSSVQTLNRMVVSGILDISYKSRSSTHYKVRSHDVVNGAIGALKNSQVQIDTSATVPEDLFSIIVGHDNIKQVLRFALDAKDRVGIVLQGPPASAKTQFLLELLRLPNSYYCLAQTTSTAGLAHILRIYEPEYLIIDEIDRLDPHDVGVLNSLLSTGIVSETKMGKLTPVQLKTKVFAAGINISKLPADLLSRFIKLNFQAYSSHQFNDVCLAILPKDGCTAETSAFIAAEVWKMAGEKADIRQAVQIARLSNGDRAKAEEVMRALKRLA